MFIDTLPPFVPGLQLCERFFERAVRPLMTEHFPGLMYSAGLLERGSDVLGFDTSQSRDHHWGPKTTIFVSEADRPACAEAIPRVMGEHLPFEIDGYPTNFDQPEVGGILRATEKRPIAHGVTVTTVERFFAGYLGVDATRPIGERDWLAMPSQMLRTVRHGRVFHDGLGTLEPARERLRWYPRDVWLYRMAAAWLRIDQEEPFVGRCGDVGDELGSRMVAARQVFELMRLCFLIERDYAPYAKWFGTAFSRLECAPVLEPIFHQVLDAPEWKSREEALGRAYLHVGAMHNALGVTEEVEPRLGWFHERPYRVPDSMRYVQALRAAITSDAVRALPQEPGGVDQFVYSTDVTDRIPRMRALAAAIYA
jgi:hypothetical protein